MEHLKNQMVLQIKEDLKDKMQALLAEENEHAQNENEILTMDTSVRDFKFPFKKVTDILTDTLKVRMHEYRSPIFLEGVEEYDGAEYYFYVEGTCVKIDCYSTLNSVINRVEEAFFEDKYKQHTSSLMVDREYMEKIYKEISDYVTEEINIYNEELEYDVPVNMNVPMGYIDDDIFVFVGATMEEVLGMELIISEETPKVNINGNDQYYYFDIGIQRIEITRTKTINQIIWETVSVIADEIISVVTEEKLWEHFFKEPYKSDGWYRVDGNTIYIECGEEYLLDIALQSGRWCDSQMEELLIKNGYEIKSECYAGYQRQYISLPENKYMTDGNDGRILLDKWVFDYGWQLTDRPRIEILSILDLIEL